MLFLLIVSLRGLAISSSAHHGIGELVSRARLIPREIARLRLYVSGVGTKASLHAADCQLAPPRYLLIRS